MRLFNLSFNRNHIRDRKLEFVKLWELWNVRPTSGWQLHTWNEIQRNDYILWMHIFTLQLWTYTHASYIHFKCYVCFRNYKQHVKMHMYTIATINNTHALLQVTKSIITSNSSFCCTSKQLKEPDEVILKRYWRN